MGVVAGELAGDTYVVAVVPDTHMVAIVGDTHVGVSAREFVGNAPVGVGLCEFAGIGRGTVWRSGGRLPARRADPFVLGLGHRDSTELPHQFSVAERSASASPGNVSSAPATRSFSSVVRRLNPNNLSMYSPKLA
jgi:hypothetical protein